jgi:hypothetical protein
MIENQEHQEKKSSFFSDIFHKKTVYNRQSFLLYKHRCLLQKITNTD